MRHQLPHRYTRTFNKLHTTPRYHEFRKSYTNVLLALAASSFLGGLTLYAVRSNVAVPRRTIFADTDAGPPKSELPEDKKSKGPDISNARNTSEPTPAYDRSCWEPSSKTVEEFLNADSGIFKVDPPCGIPRYDVSALSSGSFINCSSSTGIIELPSHYWVFFSIFHGHNGNNVVFHLANNLQSAIVGSLADLFSKHASLSDSHVDLGGGPENTDYWAGNGSGRPYPPSEEIDQAIKHGFTKVDQELVDEAAELALQAARRYHNNEPQQENLASYQDGAGLVARACCGSTAIVALYENDTRQLRLANTGDSRAVLGRRIVNDEGEEIYEVHVLTEDMDVPWGFIGDPVQRVNKRAKLVHAFGDGPWKWSRELYHQLRDAFPFLVTTEPQAKATAEPRVTTFETRPGDFLVLANSGFWSSLTNEEVVGLMGLWLKKHRRTVYGRRDTNIDLADSVTVYDPETSSVVQSFQRVPVAAAKMSAPRKDVFETQDLPVLSSGKGDDTIMYRKWGIPKKFVNVDRNAAQHLVRNAVGGADKDLMEALLKMNMPRTRQHRNDIAVEVVFFS